MEEIEFETAIDWLTAASQTLSGEVDLQTSQDVEAGLHKWLSENAADATDANQRKYVALYRISIERLLLRFDRDVRFFTPMKGHFPVHFGVRNGMVTVLVSGIASTDIFNTLRTTEISRAAQVVQQIIVPQLAIFPQMFNDSKLRAYGMLVTYGSRDFSENNSLAKSESLTVIVPADKCRQFAEALITQSELISTGETYLSAKGTKGGIKKIRIGLE